jgi:hypothetical protein
MEEPSGSSIFLVANFERIELAEPFLGSRPFGEPQLVAADYNGDGKLDIVVFSTLQNGRFRGAYIRANPFWLRT